MDTSRDTGWGARASAWSPAAARLLLLLVLSMPAASYGTPVLDQSSLEGTSEFDFGPLFFLGQTFTAGLSGTLAHVNIDLNVSSGPGSVTVTIRDGVGGRPGSTVLGSTAFTSINELTLTVPITFGTPIDLVAGEQYAIVVKSSAHAMSWIGAENNPYQGGAFSISTNGSSWSLQSSRDAHFQTFVEPVIPEPGTVLLFGSGLLWYAARCRAARARRGHALVGWVPRV